MTTGRITVRDGLFALATTDDSVIFESLGEACHRATAKANALLIHTVTDVGNVEVTAELAMYPEYSRRWEGWELASSGRFLAETQVRVRTSDGLYWNEFDQELAQMMLPSDVEFRAFVRTDRTESVERWLFELRPFLRQDLEASTREVGAGVDRGETDETPVTWSGIVDVDYHAFVLSGAEIDPTTTYTRGTVFDAGNELISVHTGIAAGPVTVVIEQYDGDPLLNSGTPPIDLSVWDNVDEVIIVCRQPLHVITLNGEIVDPLTPIPSSPTGARAFRIATRGRAKHWDLVVDHPTEEFLVQTWPSGSPSMITPVKRTDGLWDPDTSQ